MNALEFYDGCPQLLIPDNTKTGVTRACIYEPDLNPTYQEFAIHYRVAVMPTRPRKPRDKAKVESAVQVVQRWIVMRVIVEEPQQIVNCSKDLLQFGRRQGQLAAVCEFIPRFPRLLHLFSLLVRYDNSDLP